MEERSPGLVRLAASPAGYSSKDSACSCIQERSRLVRLGQAPANAAAMDVGWLIQGGIVTLPQCGNSTTGSHHTRMPPDGPTGSRRRRASVNGHCTSTGHPCSIRTHPEGRGFLPM